VLSLQEPHTNLDVEHSLFYRNLAGHPSYLLTLHEKHRSCPVEPASDDVAVDVRHSAPTIPARDNVAGDERRRGFFARLADPPIGFATVKMI
jgi:hypothetical protein